MITGAFAENSLPYVPIDVLWEDVVQSVLMVLDTGFTGDIKITPEIAQELNLTNFNIVSIKTGDGKVVDLPSYSAIASIPNTKLFVDVIVSEGVPLLGIGFLKKFGCKATVDCKNRVVQLEHA